MLFVFPLFLPFGPGVWSKGRDVAWGTNILQKLPSEEILTHEGSLDSFMVPEPQIKASHEEVPCWNGQLQDFLCGLIFSFLS